MKPTPLRFTPMIEASPVAPWSPTPLRSVRRYLLENPDAAINITFPEVFEEDRTAMIRDLGTAHELRVITHKRMSEQVAKELGIDSYDYAEEQQGLQQEQDNPLLSPLLLGAGDALAGAMQQTSPPSTEPSDLPGMDLAKQPGGARNPLGGANGLPGGGTPVLRGMQHAPSPSRARTSVVGHRAPLSGDAAQVFRRQQRTTEGRRKG